ncbi:hypothetical protein HU200_049818 [Digitaria exilis]|uniref:Uncharacterized protein n=1 Tax=Digitaria exilis TaxID=1010633 RepID=A0A835B3X3_9POAL|nr:hypothetical protein HU200_049818 [Digitaria exilis]
MPPSPPLPPRSPFIVKA